MHLAASFFSRYLLALVLTLCAYASYALIVAPQIEGRVALQRVRFPGDISASTRVDMTRDFAGLFEPHWWEWECGKIIETQQGKLLLQEYRILDDGSAEITPLSMVLRSDSAPGSQPKENPIVLRALQGAQLKFERPLDLLSGDIGELQKGKLVGPVHIYRRPSSDDANDGLSLTTSNILLSPERIQTSEAVEFHFGESHGRGQGLTVDLTNGPAKHTASAFSGIDRIQLDRLDELYLHQQRRAQTAGGAALGDTSRPLHVTCYGPFIFDFDARTASFHDQVVVRVADDSGDQLTCQELSIWFQDAATPEDQPAGQEFDISRLTAVGTPAMLHVPSRDSAIRAEVVEYDLDSSRVLVRGKQPAVVTRGHQRISAPEIRYWLDAEGRLGRAYVTGPGELHQSARAEEKELLCRWSRRLSLEVDGDKKVLSLAGAFVAVDQSTQLTANDLHLWLWEIPDDSAAEGVKKSDRRPRWTFMPAKLLAAGQVTLQSPKMTGQCSEAIAFWPPPETRQASRAPSYRVRYRPVSTARKVSTAVAAEQQAPSVPLNEVASQRGTMSFAGQQIQIQMLGGKELDAIDELTVTGGVELRQTKQSADQLIIRGNRLRAVAKPKDLFRVYVFGDDQQASVIAKGLSLLGSVINLDQPTNRMWIEGPGHMDVHRQATRNATASGLSQAGKTAIDWVSGMVFDGQQIYFEGNVLSTTQQTDAVEGTRTTVVTQSQGLSLLLNKHVNFAETSSDMDESTFEVETMILASHIDPQQLAFPEATATPSVRNLVVTSKKFDMGGKQIGEHEIQSVRAHVDVQTGNISCDGPGTVTIRQEAKQSEPGTAIPAQMAGHTSERSKPLDYVKVDFARSLAGNIEEKQLSFEGDVHTFYDEIDNFQVTPSEVDRTTLSPRAMTLDCQRLEIYLWTPQYSDRAIVDLKATGNSRIESSDFDATGQRVSYNSGTSLLVIEAPNRANAELWYRRDAAGSRGHLVAKFIQYNLSTRETLIQGPQKTEYFHQGPLRDKR